MQVPQISDEPTTDVEDIHQPETRGEIMDLIDLLENSTDNLFITGKAGTGKSTLLRRFVERFKKEAVVCAPTGVAAVNARGQTVHSLFRLPPRMINENEAQEISFRQSKVVKNASTIVIDEIGMVRGDMLQNIHNILRQSRRKPLLQFGGARIIGFGDLYQLPPIVGQFEQTHYEKCYETPYFFSAPCLKDRPFRVIDLTNVFRQSDEAFIRALNQIRYGEDTKEALDVLNSRVGEPLENAVTICPYNQQVNEINRQMLDRLPGSEKAYFSKVEGDFPKNSYPNEEVVVLKPGAQVMMLRNERIDENRFLYVNGTIATVKNVCENFVTIQIPGKAGIHRVDPVQWESIKYEHANGGLEHRIVGQFTQLPLRPAWAFTIHKSQGKTFDCVNINMGRGAFDFGQTYVALSRCRSLAGISLSNPLCHSDVMSDPAIGRYFRSAREMGMITEFHQEFDPRFS